MDRIGEHLRMLESLKDEENKAKRDVIIEAFSAPADEVYARMEAEISATLDRYLPELLSNDVSFEKEVAALEGRPPMGQNVIFAILTACYLNARMERLVADWATKKLQSLPGDIQMVLTE